LERRLEQQQRVLGLPKQLMLLKELELKQRSQM
jgi:hypothetical protein